MKSNYFREHILTQKQMLWTCLKEALTCLRVWEINKTSRQLWNNPWLTIQNAVYRRIDFRIQNGLKRTELQRCFAVDVTSTTGQSLGRDTSLGRMEPREWQYSRSTVGRKKEERRARQGHSDWSEMLKPKKKNLRVQSLESSELDAVWLLWRTT